MNISRLKKTEQALIQSYERLKIFIENRDEDAIYAALGETLLWISVIHDWHLENNEGYEQRQKIHPKGKLIFGFRFPFNLVKHNMDFIELHQMEGGVTFPIHFPLIIPPIKILWKQASNIPVDKDKRKNQRDNYIRYLQGKEVTDTIDEVFTYLMDENSVCYGIKN